MSITSAMFTGVSGLLANAEGINVIGNNLANVNTVGFKSGRMLFSDMLSVNIGNSSQIGRGTQIQKVDNVFGQGSFESTELVTDIALQGSSFFALKAPDTSSPLTSQSQAILTRAGAFRVDGDRYLVNPDGYQVLDSSGNPIRFSDNADATAAAVIAFQAADKMTPLLTTDLPADILAADTAVKAMPATTPAELAAQAAAQAIVDAATAAVATATAANTAFTATSPSSVADAAAAATAAAIQATKMAANAALTTLSATTTTDVDALTISYTLLTDQEGKAFAKVTKIGGDGTITYLDKAGNANYYTTTNTAGSPTATGVPGEKIAVINPSNPGGLDKMGGTLFQISAGAGVSTGGFSLAANSANGTTEKIYSNSLEQSNVDMAAQFVKMILTQRAYSANSKTITTADEMTQEVLQLKR